MEIHDLNDILLKCFYRPQQLCFAETASVVSQYFHKLHGIKSHSIDLNSAPNEKSETIANCVTETLKDRGLFTECFAFSGYNTKTDSGGINRSGNKNVFHAL
jgi:hypothetical protein